MDVDTEILIQSYDYELWTCWTYMPENNVNHRIPSGLKVIALTHRMPTLSLLGEADTHLLILQLQIRFHICQAIFSFEVVSCLQWISLEITKLSAGYALGTTCWCVPTLRDINTENCTQLIIIRCWFELLWAAIYLIVERVAFCETKSLETGFFAFAFHKSSAYKQWRLV